MSQKADCIFCDMVVGRSEVSSVYEDSKVIAFLDVAPLTRGHTLVVPKKHYADVFEIPPDLLAHLTKVAQNVATKMRNELGVSSVNLINSSGSEAGQDVFHFHMHVVPRKTHAELRISQATRRTRPSRKELDEIAARLRIQPVQP